MCHQGRQGFVLATVLETRGSTPRDRGAKMVVTEDAVFDTIGGGKLEQLVIDAAREALKLKVTRIVCYSTRKLSRERRTNRRLRCGCAPANIQ